MKLRVLPVLFGLVPVHAQAGGLFLPGSGAVSTSRAGAAVASADDGEALSINPAGLAKSTGWTITVAASLIRYNMEFDRRGTYDDVVAEDRLGFEGQPFAPVENKPKPPLGIGSFQPIPVIAVITDLGGRVKGLHLAAGLYAPSGYPFRDMTNGYKFNQDTTAPPPATRYDVLTSESAVVFPSIAAAYRILPGLDIGARFSAGNAQAKTSVAIWGTPNNVDESIRQDTVFAADVKDKFVPTFGIGATFRPTDTLEFGAVYSTATLRMKGTAHSEKGLGVDPDRVIGPIPDDQVRCAKGGDFTTQKGCITVQLPQNATIGGRYKFLDRYGRLHGDIELDANWENWGKKCDYTSTGIMKDPNCASPSQILVNLDVGLYNADMSQFGEPVHINFVQLGLQDTYSGRLGGSYHIVVDNNGLLDPQPHPTEVILRGGLGFDTAAARKGFLRASFDGAARFTTTVGAALRTKQWELNLGGGYIYEGKNTNPGAGPSGADCNPTGFDNGTGQTVSFGCVGDDTQRPIDQRQGPDPTNPLLDPEFQSESPYNQGSIKSSYLLFMLGYTRWW